MASTPIAVTTPDSPVTIKVAIDGSNRKFKLPLRDLNAAILPDKLRSLLNVPPERTLHLERFSDSSNSYIVLDPNNPSTYKQLYRAAKAKLKLRIKATLDNDQAAADSSTEVKSVKEDTQTPESISHPEPSDPSSSKPTATPTPVTTEAGSIKQSSSTDRRQFCDQLAAMSLDRELGRRMKEAPRQPMVGFQVSCDNCHKCIADAHFHCSICENGDYDLCEACVDSGKLCPGEEHWMIKRYIKNGKVVCNNTERQVRKTRLATVEKEPQVPGAFESEVKPEVSQTEAVRTCNACVRVLPTKLLVTCNDCDDFDLCMSCHISDKNGHHPGHTFKPIVDNAEISEQVHALCAPGRNFRHYAVCDGCEKTIYGIRHKCLDCPDWDFCNDCVSEAPKSHPDHRFVPVYEALHVPKRLANMASNYHFGIYCDGPLCKGKSNQYYIRGIRYKCAICHDTDFCAVCEAHPSNTHNATHPLIKFKTQVRNVSVSTIGEDAEGSALPVMGDQGRRRSQPTPSTAARTVGSGETPPPYTPKADAALRPLSSTPTASASDAALDAHFVRDLVKDGTEYGPDVQFRQVWTMRNPGPQSWPVGCSVRHVGGDNMLDIRRSHAASTSELSVAMESNATPCVIPPGQEINFTVSMRTPTREGKHISYWRLKTPNGTAFGHKLWCDVDVKLNGPVPSSIPPPPPPMNGNHMMGDRQAALRGLRPPPPMGGCVPPSGFAPSRVNEYMRRQQESARAARPNGSGVADFQIQLMQLEQQNKQYLARMRARNQPGYLPFQNRAEGFVGGQNRSVPSATPAHVKPTADASTRIPLAQDERFANIKSQLNQIEEQQERNRKLLAMTQGIANTPPPPLFPSKLAQRFKKHPMPAHPDIDATSSEHETAESSGARPVPYAMNPQDRKAATAAAAAAASAASAAMKDDLDAPPAPATAPSAEKEEEEEMQGSAMVFPKLDKESPTSSTQLDDPAPSSSSAVPPASSVATVTTTRNDTATETETITSAGEEEQFETLSAADVEFYEASEEGSDEDDDDEDEAFLTDEEYDILDASDEEFMNRGKSGL